MAEASDVSFGLEVTKGVIARFAMAIIGFVGMIIFAHKLGPDGIGSFYLLYAVAVVVDRPLMGWANACKKRYSEINANREQIVGAALGAGLVYLIPIGLGAFLFRSRLASYTNLNDSWALFIVFFVFLSIFSVSIELVWAQGRLGLANGLDTARSVATFPAQLSLVIVGLGAAGLVIGEALATALLVPVTLYFVGVRPHLPRRAALQSIFDFARYSIPQYIVGNTYERFDVLLLGYLMTTTQVGYYEVAARITLPAIFLATVASGGLMARISSHHSKENSEAATTDLRNTIAFSSIVAIPILFGSLSIGEALVVTFAGADFAPAAPFLIGLALIRVIKTQSAPIGEAIMGLDRPRLVLRISSIMLAINIVTGIFLTIRLGGIGVVIATLIAEILGYTLLVVTARSLISFTDPFPRELGQQFVAGFTMFVAVSGLHLFVSVSSWIDLLFLVGFGAFVYAITLFLLSQSLRMTMRHVLRDAGLLDV